MANKDQVRRAEELDVKKATGVLNKYPRERKEISSNFITCWIGAGNDNDYVVQLEPTHPKRRFPDDLADACMIVRKHLVNLFPRHCNVDIDPPLPDWKIQHITFLVNGAMNVWSFQPDSVEKAIPAMLAELDRYVEAYAKFLKPSRPS